MTAYRSADAPPDQPYVNPHLERALLEYYRKLERRYVVSFALGVAATVACVVGVLVFRPPDVWLINGLVAVVPAYAAIRMGLALRRRRSQLLLDRIRTGIAIRRVLRSTDMFRVLATDSRGAAKDMPTILVEFVDGRAMMLPSLGDHRHLARIEHLLNVQMKEGGAPRRPSAR